MKTSKRRSIIIRVNPKKVLVYLSVVALFFMIAHLILVSMSRAQILPLASFEPWVALDAENTIPAWFSANQFLFLGLLAMVRYFQLGRQNKNKLRRFYSFMIAAFLFFSLDEAAQVHERMAGAVENNLHIYSPLIGGKGTFILVYGVIFLLLLGFMIGPLLAFLREKPARTAFLSGAAVFVLGATVLEAVAYYVDAGYYLDFQGLGGMFLKHAEHQILIILKEGAELLGESIMIYALLLKIGSFSISLGTSTETVGKVSSK